MFLRLCKEFENIEEMNFDENHQPNLPLTTPLVQKKIDIDRSALHSFKGPLELLQANIADLRLVTKLNVNPKYCLLVVELFTSKICIDPMKRTLLKRSLDQFYGDISKKRKSNQEIRLETDQ